jgi:hypothetical protein
MCEAEKSTTSLVRLVVLSFVIALFTHHDAVMLYRQHWASMPGENHRHSF